MTTDFVLDLRGLPTMLAAGEISYLPGMPQLGYAQDGDWLSSLVDAQGSVLQTIDAQGTTSPLQRYDPYGNARPGSMAATGIGYSGEWSDPTGLLNLRFRAYDPSIGRFLSRDTFSGIPAAPQSANRYSYSLGNPVRYADPSGHFVTGLSEFAGPCSVQLLSCTVEDFESMTFAARVEWVEAFQGLYVNGGWFNAFECFIAAVRDGGYGPDSWISTVDARVLANMQNGYLASINRVPLDKATGTAEMERLFRSIAAGDHELAIIRLHVEAEQATVDYGQQEAEDKNRVAGIGERAMLLAANQWRSLTHESAGLKLANQHNPVGVVADWAFDPRNRDLAYQAAVNIDRLARGPFWYLRW